jgi:hypothetical protein
VNRIQNFAAATDVAQIQTGLILCGPIAAAKSEKNIIIALRTACEHFCNMSWQQNTN